MANCSNEKDDYWCWCVVIEQGSRISNLIIGGLHFSVGSAEITDLLRFKKLNSLDWDLIYLPGQAADVGSLRQRSEAANAILFSYESNENGLHGKILCPM
jgi:hypothetical protein